MTSPKTSYELEQMVWDEICECDDRIVPHHTDEQDNEHRQNKSLEKNESTKDGPTLNNKSNEVNNSFDYPLNHMSEAENDLNYFGTNQETKDSNDLLYYNWSDMGNFDDDVDQMFRNCDSTFGDGSRNEDNNLDWFSSEDASKFENIEEDKDSSRLNDRSGSKKSNMQSSSIVYQSNTWTSSDQLSFSNAQEQIDEQKMEMKHENEQYLEENSFLYDNNMSETVQENKGLDLDCDTYQYLGNDSPYMVQSNQTKVISENNSSLTSLSPRDSYTSNHVQSNEDEKNNISKNVQASISDRTSIENLVYYDIEGEIGSDDISDEATSFRQLRLVLEQLDLGTKLCIRDSLYRLARSAEQRHNFVKINGSSGDDREVLVTEATNKYNGLMDMETETNPMDRSMAHLLYHQSAETSVMPGYESISFSSPVQTSF